MVTGSSTRLSFLTPNLVRVMSYSWTPPVLLPRPTTVHMCLSPGTGISPNAWLWGTDTSWATRPPAASSLLPPHRHLSRGHFLPLRWQRRFRHCPSLCKPRHRSPTLRAAAVPSVGVTAKSPWAGSGWPRSPLLRSHSSATLPAPLFPAAGLRLPSLPALARNPQPRVPSSAIPTCTAKPSPSSKLGAGGGGGVYLSFGS